MDQPPRLDGTLDDPLWQLAKLVGDFRQREPLEGEAATKKTEVRILYTRTAVYFGFIATIPLPRGLSPSNFAVM